MSRIPSLVSELASTFSGRLVEPSNPDYDEARRVHNGLIDKRPALIAQCRGLADIVDAVRAGRSLGREVAVRGGGHNVGGRATTDGGLMIDLSLMRGVHVDPKRRTARAEGGAVWRDFNKETQLYKLATTGGVVGTTGIGGLTLGGGFGWLMGKFGMALDNLVSVDLVLADGSVVRASADDHPDLFWAVRGGGGNFGIAGSFEFQLHDLGPTVIGGIAAWPVDRARDVFHFYRDLTAAAPDDMMVVVALLTAPDGSGHKLVAIGVSHVGPQAEAEKAVAPIKKFGTPVLDIIGPMPYTALNSILDDAFPRGTLNYWKSHFIDDLTDPAIDVFIDRFTSCPTPLSQMLLENFHGAAARVPVGNTAYALRATGYNAGIFAQWTDPAENDTCTRWAKESYAAVKPFTGAKRYVNYLDADDSAGGVLEAVYGPNLPRLRQLKKQYDPDNFFRLNVNIPPA
jgi:FAD/FMN-containing dehydrogenase